MTFVDLAPAAWTLVFAAGAALVVTPIVRSLAFRVDVVSRPAADRWNQNATALLGGVALFFAVAVGLLAPALLSGGGWVLAGD